MHISGLAKLDETRPILDACEGLGFFVCEFVRDAACDGEFLLGPPPAQTQSPVQLKIKPASCTFEAGPLGLSRVHDLVPDYGFLDILGHLHIMKELIMWFCSCCSCSCCFLSTITHLVCYILVLDRDRSSQPPANLSLGAPHAGRPARIAPQLLRGPRCGD